jgi:hypothetical protein
MRRQPRVITKRSISGAFRGGAGPASTQIYAGARPGHFRIGGDPILAGGNGRSHIAYEDFATTIRDEIEQPRHIAPLHRRSLTPHD